MTVRGNAAGEKDMFINRLDHFVLTVANIDETCRFYEKACRMATETFGAGRKALRFGHEKINLHQRGKEFEPKALHPTSGSADFCLITTVPLEEVVRHLSDQRIPLEQGIVDRTGATGPIRSIYIRDPDGNLVEISNYVQDGA